MELCRGYVIILLLFAFLSGVVTVLSPCILPVLPILLSVSVGQGRYRPYGIISGLVISFAFFTLSLTALVHTTGISPNILRYIAILLIIFFGLTMLFPELGNFFAVKTSVFARLGNIVQTESQFLGNGFLSGFVIGAALGLIWTPCAGPILATVTTLVATHAVTAGAVILTIAYSLGTALPMFLIMYGGNRIIYSTQFLAQYTELIRRFFGALMIMGALSIALHADRVLLQFTAKYFPAVSIENNKFVKKELGVFMPTKIITNQDTAPEIVGIESWINSDPLTLEKLRGKVVLIDFWTYSCINCIRTLPYIKEWYKEYKDAGLVIIGVHTPEFEFEKKLSNVQDAVKSFDITYPVALDNTYSTWQNYSNHYWPAHYVIDQDGFIKETHFGEGGYLETENAIRNLLNLPALSKEPEKIAVRAAITPETYLGYARAQAYTPEIKIQEDQVALYTYKNKLADNTVGLKGAWRITREYIQAEDDNALLELNFIAQNVYLVMQSPEPKDIKVLLDGKQINQVTVAQARMYTLCELKDNSTRYIMVLEVPKGVLLYVFTFG